MSIILSEIQKNQNEKSYFFEILKSLDSQCRNCTPISPLECITRCKVYRLKNELRVLRKSLINPSYLEEFFNVLKNETSLHILTLLGNSRCPLSQIQVELKIAGTCHSKSVICHEFLQPLTSLGLVCESDGEYYLTLLGNCLSKRFECFAEFSPILPGNSKCYEEIVLQHLLSGSKTFESIEEVILLRNVSRTIKRLRSTGLIKTTNAREYVFFFKTKRDPSKEILTATERKIYNALDFQGISIGNLTKQTNLSKRVTYRCIKQMKGKKLVFQRRTPKTYDLSDSGRKLATILFNLKQIVEDAWCSFQKISRVDSITMNIEALPDRGFSF